MNKFTVSLIPFTFFENWSKEWIISDWKKKIETMRSKCTEEDTVYMSRRRSNVVNPQVRNSKSAYFSQFDFPYSTGNIFENFKDKDDLYPTRNPLKYEHYAIVFYKPGSFFKRHSDGRKSLLHVGTALLLFPLSLAPHIGGDLILYPKGGSEVRIRADPECFTLVKFTVDMEHEVSCVESGERIVIKSAIFTQPNEVLFNNTEKSLQLDPISENMASLDSDIEEIDYEIERLKNEKELLMAKKISLKTDPSFILPSQKVLNFLEKVQNMRGNVIIFLKEEVQSADYLTWDSLSLWNEIVKLWPYTNMSFMNIEMLTGDQVQDEFKEPKHIENGSKEFLEGTKATHRIVNNCHGFNVLYFFDEEHEIFDCLKAQTEYNDANYDVKLIGTASCIMVQKDPPDPFLFNDPLYLNEKNAYIQKGLEYLNSKYGYEYDYGNEYDYNN